MTSLERIVKEFPFLDTRSSACLAKGRSKLKKSPLKDFIRRTKFRVIEMLANQAQAVLPKLYRTVL